MKNFLIPNCCGYYRRAAPINVRELLQNLRYVLKGFTKRKSLKNLLMTIIYEMRQTTFIVTKTKHMLWITKLPCSIFKRGILTAVDITFTS